MPILVKVLITLVVLDFSIAMIGINTVRNEKLQKILTRSFIAIAFLLFITAIVGVWYA